MKAEGKNPMNKMKFVFIISALFVLILTSACGKTLNSGLSHPEDTQPSEIVETEPAGSSEIVETEPADSSEIVDTKPAGSSEIVHKQPSATHQEKAPPKKVDTAKPDKEILITIDQTAKPSGGNSFDFFVNQVPEGYSLTEMQWISGKNKIVNTTAEAIKHGENGEDGFYITGKQYSGFIYSDTMKGEEGQVVFVFKDDQGKELSWKKKVTLNE
jgi:hypothetical protein